MMVGEDYHFFNRANHPAPDDFPEYYSELLSFAEVSVKIWDPYFNSGDEDLFTNVQAGVNVTIMYMYKAPVGRRSFSPLPADVKSWVSSKLPRGAGTLKVAYLPSTDASLFEERKWHDRFLILDDTLVFLIGASLTSQMKNAKCFGIYDITSNTDAALIMERFEKTLYEVENRGYWI